MAKRHGRCVPGQQVWEGIGEVNGTKWSWLFALLIVGKRSWNLARAAHHIDGGQVALVISFDTGGVRLQEANAGLLAHSEVMDAFQEVRGKVPIIGLIGGTVGCFGGMGFVASSVDVLIMSDVGRLGLTGPGLSRKLLGLRNLPLPTGLWYGERQEVGIGSSRETPTLLWKTRL